MEQKVKEALETMMTYINKEMRTVYIALTVLFIISSIMSTTVLLYAFTLHDINKVQTERIIELEKVANWDNVQK